MSSVRIPNKSGYDGKSSFHPDSDQRCILEDAILHSLLFTRSLGSVGERLVTLVCKRKGEFGLKRGFLK